MAASGQTAPPGLDHLRQHHSQHHSQQQQHLLHQQQQQAHQQQQQAHQDSRHRASPFLDSGMESLYNHRFQPQPQPAGLAAAAAPSNSSDNITNTSGSSPESLSSRSQQHLQQQQQQHQALAQAQAQAQAQQRASPTHSTRSNTFKPSSTSPHESSLVWSSSSAAPTGKASGGASSGLGFAHLSTAAFERGRAVSEDISQRSFATGPAAAGAVGGMAGFSRLGGASSSASTQQQQQQHNHHLAHLHALHANSPRPAGDMMTGMLSPASAAHSAQFSFSSSSDRASSPGFSAPQTGTDGTSATSRSALTSPPPFGHDSQHSSVSGMPGSQRPRSGIIEDGGGFAAYSSNLQQHHLAGQKGAQQGLSAFPVSPAGYPSSYLSGRSSSPTQSGHTGSPPPPPTATQQQQLHHNPPPQHASSPFQQDVDSQQHRSRERFFSADGTAHMHHLNHNNIPVSSSYWRQSLDNRGSRPSFSASGAPTGPGAFPISSPSWPDSPHAGNPAAPSSMHPQQQHQQAALLAAAAAANLQPSGSVSAASATSGSAGGSGSPNEFSIFVGDLAPNLREEDLVAQFLRPPVWPPAHPLAIAHAQAQQARGIFAPSKVGPAPFISTKSAKIMTDPVTGASRGFGFVRFSNETDSLRALIEMQGVYIAPLDGQSSGRPLRVCPATPKNKSPVNGSAYEAELLAKAYPGGAGGGPRGFHPGQAPTYNPAARPDPYAASQQVAALGNLPQALQLLQAHTARSRDGSPASAAGMPRDPYGSPMSPTPPHASSAAMTSSALDPNNTTVFVGGLSSLISEDTLRTFFVPFGEIAYVKIPPGKGCGFVQFVRKVDAERAIERMQGFPIGGGRIRLSWGRSQGDKAAAAAAHAASQAAQLGQLASLAGLGGLSASQLAQLAGLSSALSAVQQSGNGAGAMPTSLGHSAELEANSALLHQLAAASVGLANQAPGSAPPAGFADHLHFRSSTQPGVGTPGTESREAELLRSVYAGLSPHLSSNGSHQPHQQMQNPSQAQPHHASHQSGYQSLHQQVNHAQQDRSAADHLTSALSNMDIRREENARTYYQSGEMPPRDISNNRGFEQHRQSPSPGQQQAWQHRNAGEDPSQQHRASPHSMLKASTFAPFSPAESPVVAEATLAPESGPHNHTAGNRQSSSLSTTSSQTLQQQQQQQQHRHPHQI